MCDQGPLCRESAPLMMSGASAVALSWMCIRKRIRCPIFKVPLPASEFQDKLTEINGLTEARFSSLSMNM